MKIFLAIMFVSVLAGYTNAQLAKTVVADVRSFEKIVKGAPFTAEAVTESVQMLADGTRITRTSTSKLYRDSDGRYRREDNKQQLGLPGANVEMNEAILLVDPVLELRYVLDVKNKTFRDSSRTSQFRNEVKRIAAKEKLNEIEKKRIQMIEKRAEAKAEAEAEEKEASTESFAERVAESKANERLKHLDVQRGRIARQLSDTDAAKADDGSKQEQLGTKTIEGVQAEGKRTTTIIPVGAIGNDREINIVYEKWYSNELMMTVFSKHTDPRFGEQTYQLKNISRTEPPASLFTPPSDFKLVGEKKAKFPSSPKAPSSIKSPKPPSLEIKPPVPGKPPEGKKR